MHRYALTTAVLATSASLILTACNIDDPGTGTLSLNITDAPVDNADHVYVTFTGVTLKHEAEEPRTITFEDDPKRIDLLSLQGDAFEGLFAEETVTAGRYEWIRLAVNADRNTEDSVIVLDGSEHSLFIPSGTQTGLKLVSGFDVPRNGSASFTLDFDLRRSVVQTGSGNGQGNRKPRYILKPVLRLVDNARVGHIKGSVNLADFECPESGAAVYLYSGHDVTPTDIYNNREDGTDPILTATVSDKGDDGDYTYTAGFLSEGDYTVAFTCNSDEDDTASENNIAFEHRLNTQVTAGSTTVVDIAAVSAE